MWVPQNPWVILILVMLVLLPSVKSLTGPQIIGATNKYINIYSYVFNTVPYYGNTTVNLRPFTYNLVFPYVKSDTTYHTGVSIGQLNYYMPSTRQLNYSLDVGIKTTADVQIDFYANTANKISQLIIYILIIETGFKDVYFNYFWYSLATTFTAGQSIIQYQSGVTPSVPTATSSIFQTIIGIDLVASDTTYEVGFSINTVFASSTSINIAIKSLSTKNTKLNAIYVMVFIYSNSQLAVVSPAAAYTLRSFSGTAANNSALQWANSSVRAYNTFIGLTAFSIKGDAFFNYNAYISNGVAAMANSSNNWLQFSFCVNLYLFQYCPDITPYLMVSANLCYDICPPRYCSNNSDYQCDACPTYDCYYCSYNGSCSACNATADFRYMNNATMRCLPLPGYYDAGVSQAVPCVNTSCLTCTTAIRCLTCYPGKFLSGTICISCIANCANCTTSTTCVICNTYYKISGTACVPNCTLITNCLTCNVNITLNCLTCITGYSLVNNTCIEVCGDGMLVTPELCDDNNTVSGDGCSSTCILETAYYCNTAVSPTQCTHCIANCDNCSTTTTCTVCSIGYLIVNSTCVADCSSIQYCATCNYNATLAGPQCLTAQTGYYVLSNNTCASTCGDGIRVPSQGCDDGNTTSGDGCSATCTVQSGYYCVDTFPNASVCSTCIPFCLLCTSNATCSNCSTAYLYNNTQNACTIDCTVVAQCLTCNYSGTTQCQTCAIGYHINIANNSCDIQCGDGIRVASQGCDDNNTNATDGCSPTCVIQSGFYCVDTFPNASVCSACIPFCTLCTNNNSCSNCSTYYSYNSTQNACIIDCTVIAQCLTCDYNGTTRCLACATGYHINSANNSCDTQCGDGIRVASQGCDDNNTNSTDGCSSTCTIQSGFFCVDTFPNASVCSACIPFCTLCTNNASCSNCSTYYSYNSTLNACTIDCTVVIQCATCDYNGTTQCLTCNIGYLINSANNSCDTQCGDGFKVGAEACDDGNNVSSDGCSSTCTVEPAFFCVDTNVTGGVKSSCTACLSFCINCTTATTCGTCQTGYTINSTSCAIDCTPISLCLTCNFTTSLNCMSCTTGYYPTSNVCLPNCGDGIVVTTQACDDGNPNSNDGCSSNCTIQPAFLCTNNTVNGSLQTSCTPCLAHCIDCSGNINDCVTCDTGYIYNSSGLNITCDVDCATFLDCSTCTFSACTACSAGYSLDATSNCVPTCGDGKVMMGEICDDGNTVSGDGCSNVCQVQVNYGCNTVKGKSVCSILSLGINFVSLMKVPTANSISIIYQISPSGFAGLSTLDWSTVVYQQSNLSMSFSSFIFDSSSSQLNVNADYAQPLDYQTLLLGFNFPVTAPFDMINATNTSTLLVADNNLKLDVYTDEDYQQSKTVAYIAMAQSVIGFLLFLLGYLSGKLIGLQCVTVLQLTFLSLVTCDNLTPSFSGLSYLGYSCGYNINSLQKSTVKIGRRFNPVGYNEHFLNNYNLTSMLFLLPLILSLIFTLINRFRDNSANHFLLKHSQLLRGEGCFYGLMFSAYTIFLSLDIQLTHMGVGMMGLAVGAVLFVAIIAFGVGLHRHPQLFGEFNDKFAKDTCIQSHYYCVLIVERVLTAGCLLMAIISPQGAIIVLILAVQIVMVVWKKPYAGERAWIRPFLNLLFSILIQTIYILTPMLSRNKTISGYLPFAVEALLAVVLGYNIYYYVKQIKGEVKAVSTIDEEEGFMKQQFSKLELFQQKMMDGAKLKMLDKTHASHSPLADNDPDSPSKLFPDMLSNVRDKLSKVKLTSSDVCNVSLEGAIEFDQDEI